ncbi:MAG TPA: thioredoxin [Bacteroidales bacterium]|nr:MAG: hypothetical protein A2X11_10940 [Bacteroidetes bacterium GWE2_42_24]OFY32062.1 MAG: hypothetical protein A2X09_10505 [Bacteroidetes bacterium GWF2_43_11]HBZ66330.1 thioredoxin [Bacteroidales bacterium]
MLTNLRKLLLFVSLLISLLSVQGQSTGDQKIEWLTFQEAIKRNATNPKKIFIDVFTDWCGWCKRMDATTFKDSTVVMTFNKYFHAVKLDAEGNDTVVFSGYTFINPNPGGKRSTHQLAAALLQGKMSYPSFVILDDSNRMLTTLPGFQPVERIIPVLNFFGENNYKKMSWEQYSQKIAGQKQMQSDPKKPE